LLKEGEEVVAISWMVLTAPETTEKLAELKEATPLTEVVASMPATVNVPPKETGEPETDNPVPEVAETLIEELTRYEFKMELLGKDSPEETVNDPPIPTLPVVPKVAAEMLLVTDNESRIAAEETVKDWPIPTLPETFKDDPMPTKPEK